MKARSMGPLGPAVLVAGLVLLAALPVAEGGVFIGLRQDRVDLSRGEQPSLVVSFDEKLSWAEIHVVADEGGFSKKFALSDVRPGRERVLSWSQPAGIMGYTVQVTMKRSSGEVEVEETWIEVAAATPLTASIPADSVKLDLKSFELRTNHPPTHVDIEVLADDRQPMGTTRVQVDGLKAGDPIPLSWVEEREARVFRIVVRAHDMFGYWAEVEIVPWSLYIDHEDVNFETGSDQIVALELPKLDAPWSQIREAITTYGQWVRCALYVAGYTDTVGDGAANRALSERRALSLARQFRKMGAEVPIYYRGYGESVLAVPTPDSTDEARNRRALYVVTAGDPPRGSSTPPGPWKRLN